MAKVNFKRIEDSSLIDNYDIEDGSFWVTGDGKTYIDYGTERIAIAGTPDTQMSDVSRNTVENNVIKSYVDDKYDKLGGVIAWTNPNPTNSFSAGSISLSRTFSEGFDSYEILFRQSNQNTRLMSTGIIPKNNGTILNYCTQTTQYRATSTTMYNDMIVFEDAYPNNTACIPMYVILYNKGLF